MQYDKGKIKNCILVLLKFCLPEKIFVMQQQIKISESELNPMSSLDVWEDDVLERYPEPGTIAKEKNKEEFRNYEDPKRETVREFYRLNHKYQSYDFVLAKRKAIPTIR